MDYTLPVIDIAPDLLEDINRKLLESNRFTDDNGILIGSNWVNWKKETAPQGEKFLAVFLIDGNHVEAICKFNFELSNITNELDWIWEIEPKWIEQIVHIPQENILYWREYDNYYERY